MKSAPLALLPAAAAAQFVPPFVPLNGLFATSKLRAHAARYWTSAHQAQTAESAGGDSSLVEHAKDCIDHFGECTVEEMEDMRLSLHAERLKNLLTKSSDASWPQDEMDQRTLEHDLSLQLDLLKEHIGADEMTTAEMAVANAAVHHLTADEMVNDLGTVDAVVQHPQDEDAAIGTSELHMRGDSGINAKEQVTAPKVRPVAAVPVPVPLSDAVAPSDHAEWNPWIEDYAVGGWNNFDVGTAETVALATAILLVLLLPDALHVAQV